MGKHATLSASSSSRWLNCLPSALLELEFKDKTSDAAASGTAAHNLCESKLKKALGIKSKRPVSIYDSDEMEEHTDAYVDFVMEQLELEKQVCKDPLLLIEQRLDFSSYVPEGFGTGDCIIVSDEKLHIIDFKYGIGILVDAIDNSQMQLYSLGALEAYDSLYDIKEVSMTIFQPRRDNISTWTIPVKELKAWAETELRPKAQKAIKGEGEFIPGEWCTFCRASVKCRARADQKLELAKFEFKLPPILTDIEIEEIIHKLPDMTKWANTIMAYAVDAAINHGKEWNGFKVVRGRSNRKYKDEEAVAKKAKENGYEEIFRQSLIPLTEMQKLMGKTKFDEILGGLIYKPPGKLTLVPVEDKRAAVSTMNLTKSRRSNIMENQNKTKVITGVRTRLSYFNGWEPVSINGGTEKYGVSLLIPKDDTETINAINAAVDAAIEEGIAKFGGKNPNKAAIKLPMRDGDVERDDEAYKGHYFLNANSMTAPQIVDKTVKPILDRNEVYSGCYGRVSLNFYAFNSNGNKGIACGLGNIQKIKDGEPLGGRTNAAAEFTTLEDDDFLS